jgi:acyl-CoA hydrolase
VLPEPVMDATGSLPGSPPVPPSTPRASRVETVNVVLPGLTNARGSIFGGILMQWIDIAGAIAAGRHAQGPVVTASMDRLHFLEPVRLGAVVILQAQVNFAARTSVEVGVRVFVEDLRTGSRAQATRAYLTFVAVDDEGRPRPLPALVLENDEDRRRFTAAARRRQERLAERQDIGKRHD